MVTKLLLTVLVIVGMLSYVRHRTGARPQQRRPLRVAAPASYRRLVPAVLLLCALGVGAGMFWLQWREANRVYTVRVIDTRSGEVRRYLVHRKGVQGRTFETIDGRRITLADVERMELSRGRAGAGE